MTNTYRIRVDKYTRSAKGKPCQMRLEGCMPDNETVVFAHLNGAGMGLKALPIHGAYLCLNCHDIYDGRKTVDPPYKTKDLELEMLRAIINTQRLMIKTGIIPL